MSELEIIEKSLECPICFDIMDLPIRLCDTGHMFCGGCRKKLEKCPFCEGMFTNTRNFLAESLLVKILKYCSNKNGGCDFKTHGALSQEVLEMHEKSCSFRPFICNMSGPFHICKNTKIRCKNMASHLKDGHRLQGFQGTTAVGSWQSTKESLQAILQGNEQRCDSFYLECHDKMFLACQLLVRSKVLLYAVLVGNSGDAKEFRVIIKMENNRNGIETTWKGPVHSIRRPPAQLLTDGKGLYLTPETFFTLTTPTALPSKELSWTVNYEIERIDDPVAKLSSMLMA